MKKLFLSFLSGVLFGILPINGILRILQIIVLGYLIGGLSVINNGIDVVKSYFAIVCGEILINTIVILGFSQPSTGILYDLGLENSDILIYSLSVTWLSVVISYGIFYTLSCYLSYYRRKNTKIKPEVDNHRLNDKDIQKNR